MASKGDDVGKEYAEPHAVHDGSEAPHQGEERPSGALQLQAEGGHDEIEVNKRIIIAALAELGATYATVEYDGSGDDGRVQRAESDAGGLSTAQVDAVVSECEYRDGAWVEFPEVRRMTVTEALERLCQLVIEKHHWGFENDEGGGGKLTLDVATGKLTLEKWDYCISRDEDTVDL